VRNLFINIGLVFLSLVGTFFIAEFATRILYRDTLMMTPRYHKDFQYGKYTIRGIRPNLEFWHKTRGGSWKFTTNRQGFRNYRDFDYAKPDGIIRVLSLGDSQTLGHEVRQEFTYSAVLERYLEKNGYKAEVMNTGVSGFGTAEELAFLENEGIKYSPDFVIVGFFANDFLGNVKADLFRLEENDSLVEKDYVHIPGVRIQNIIYDIPLVKWLSENSYFYSLLFNYVWIYFRQRLTEKSSGQVAFEYAIVTEEEFTDYQIRLTAALLRRMHLYCQRNNAKLIILDIPRRQGEYGSKSSFPEALVKSVTNFGGEYLASDSILEDFSEVGQIYVPHGHHISEMTHTLIGITIGKHIIDHLQ